MRRGRRDNGKTRLLWSLVTAGLVLAVASVSLSAYLFQRVEALSREVDTVKKAGLQPPAAAQPSGAEAGRVTVSSDDDPVKGPTNAPVTIVEFSEFECSFCGRFFAETLPLIEKKYIETGKVRLVFRDYPIGGHQYAQKAAEAAECADDQARFWDYHDTLFQNQGALDVSSLKQYARDLGLDAGEFDTCLDSGKMASEVQNDLKAGQSYGVSGTPTFFINGIKVVGAKPYDAFEQVIEAELGQ